MRCWGAARILIAITGMDFSNYDTHCPTCGLAFGPDEQFCPRCGARLPTRGDGVEEAGGGGGVRLPSGDEGAAPATDGDGVPWTPVHVTAGLFIFLGLVIAAAFISGALGSLLPDYERALRTWVGVHLLALGIVALVWFLGARLAADPLGSLSLSAPQTSPGLSVMLTVMALTASLVLTFVYGFTVDRLGLEFLRPPEIDDDVIFPGAGILLTLQALSLVTPISEELLFRGFVLRGLLRSIGPGPAVAASALVFAALHLEPGAMIPIFLTGIVLGWLFVRTGSVWPCVAAHAAQNTLALMVTRYL